LKAHEYGIQLFTEDNAMLLLGPSAEFRIMYHIITGHRVPTYLPPRKEKSDAIPVFFSCGMDNERFIIVTQS
jgi:hypothetical protein